MEQSLIIAGFGGQGVMSMGHMLGYAASGAKKSVTFFPSYGAEQRGGTANCTVVISDDEIGSPIATKPDVLIAMNDPSYRKFKDRVKSNGIIMINSSLIKGSGDRDDIKECAIPVNDMAIQIGNPKAANLVMLGAYIALTNILAAEDIKEMIKKTLGSKADLLEANLNAFDAGFDYIVSNNAN